MPGKQIEWPTKLEAGKKTSKEVSGLLGHYERINNHLGLANSFDAQQPRYFMIGHGFTWIDDVEERVHLEFASIRATFLAH